MNTTLSKNYVVNDAYYFKKIIGLDKKASFFLDNHPLTTPSERTTKISREFSELFLQRNKPDLYDVLKIKTSTLIKDTAQVLYFQFFHLCLGCGYQILTRPKTAKIHESIAVIYPRDILILGDVYPVNLAYCYNPSDTAASFIGKLPEIGLKQFPSVSLSPKEYSRYRSKTTLQQVTFNI